MAQALSKKLMEVALITWVDGSGHEWTVQPFNCLQPQL